MVRNDVEDLTHPNSFELFDKSPIFLLGSNLRVELIVVQDIVSMKASFLGHKIRGTIAIGDPQFMEIGNNRLSIYKPKLLV
jgi:hypothetical protein